MYNDSFWDTVMGQRLAASLTEYLPKITVKRKQYIEEVKRECIPVFLQERLEKGERFVKIIHNSKTEDTVYIIMEVDVC